MLEDEASLIFTGVTLSDADTDSGEDSGDGELSVVVSADSGGLSIFSKMSTTGCGDVCSQIYTFDFV